MSAIRQTNFAGGEIAPMCWGRNDLAFFARGLRTMRNFFPTRMHGAAVSRPGSLYITTTKDPSADNCRLIPFVYSDEESFCIEVGINATGHLYFRFFTNGGQVISNATEFAGGPYELTAGLTDADLSLLKWAQTGNVLTLTHPDFPPQELRRLANWSAASLLVVSDKATAAGTAAAIALSAGSAFAQNTGYAPMTTTALQASSTVFNAIFAMVGYPAFAVLAKAAYIAAFRAVYSADASVSFAEGLGHTAGAAAVALLGFNASVNDSNAAYAAAYIAAFDAAVVNSPRWTLTSVGYRNPDPYFGGTAGSYPVLLESTLSAADATHPDREWVYLCSLTVQDVATGRIFETLPWRIREKWNGVAINPTSVLADDLHAVYPDQPITIRRGSHLDLSTLNVVQLGYREICMNVYRGRAQLFGLLGTTDTDAFVDDGREPDYLIQPLFGTNPFLITDAAGVTTLENPAAVAFFQDRRVFLATERRPDVVFASAVGDYANFDRHELLHVSGESVLFGLAARKFERGKHLVSHQKLIIGTGSTVWRFSGAGDSPLDFNSIDARIVEEVGMTDLPPLMVDSVVLYGRAKGSGVRGLKFDANFGTYQGADLSGQSDHLFVGDAVGFQGTNTNKEIVDWTYAEDPWGLVWAVRADGTLLSLTLRGQEYGWARHDGNPTSRSTGTGTPATYRRVCAVPEGDEDAVYMLVTRAIGGTFGVTCVERMTSRVRRGTTEDDACVDCGLRYEGVPVMTITGLDHLWGESVWVVGKDNAPQGPFVVQKVNIGTIQAPVYSYQITLTQLPTANNGAGGVVLFVGLLYTPDLETLDAVSADSKLKQKAVTQVGFEVDQAFGILAGQDFEHLTQTRPNTVSSGYGPPVPGTELVIVTPNRKWDVGGRAVLRQSLPLPVSVVGLVRELEVGG